MSYAALDLSKYIINKCIKEACPISNLQLQKILYYIQKDFLDRGDIAFYDDIEAWQFGPVVPNVYYHYCGYGAMSISVTREKFEVRIKDKPKIDKIVEEKRHLYPWTMVNETHKKNGAWDQIYKGGLGNHKVIPVDLIREAG